MRTTLYPMLASRAEFIGEDSLEDILSEACDSWYHNKYSGHVLYGFISQSKYLSLFKGRTRCSIMEIMNYRENKKYTKNNEDVYCLFFEITYKTTEQLPAGIESIYFLFHNRSNKSGVAENLTKVFDSVKDNGIFMKGLTRSLDISEEYIKSNLILYYNEPRIIHEEHLMTYYFALRLPLSVYLSRIAPDETKLRITRI